MSFREKDVRNMEPVQKSTENSAAGYLTTYRIHRDQNFMCEFWVKLFKSCILIHHCINEYGETLNSEQKSREMFSFLYGKAYAWRQCLLSKTQENLQDLRNKHNCLNDGWCDITDNMFVV